MKRFIKAALLLFTIALTSCSKKLEGAKTQSSLAEPTVLTVWCWDKTFNIFAMKTASEIYTRDNPNVKINVVEIPWADLEQKLITSLSANDSSSLPDIILMQDHAIQKNLANYPKAFLPVNNKIDLSKFAPYKLSYGEANGKIYSVPFDNGATCTFLRTDILEKAGLKAQQFNNITWDEFHEYGKIVKAKTGKPLISYVVSEPDCIIIMMQSAGTWMFDEKGKANLANNAVLEKAVKVYSDMIKDGVCLNVTDWNAYVASINNGSAASAINGCWLIDSIMSQSEQSGKWAVANTPRLSGVPNAVNYSNQGGSSWLVMSNSKHAEIAMDFLNKTFASSKELYDTILPSSGAISTWLPAADSSVYDEPSAFFGGQKIYKDIVEYSKHVPSIRYGLFNYEARNAVGVAVSKILQGSSIADALNEAQKNIEFQMGY